MRAPALCAALTLLAAAPVAAADLGRFRTWDGTVLNGQYGIACVVVGDMDGDGYADFAVGASADTTGGPGAGRVFIYRGGPHLGEPPAEILTGLPGDLLGASLAAAGDVDGDGYADLLIGAPAGTTANPSAPGRVVLVYGSSPLGTRPPVSIPGTAAASRFGAAVAGLGSFNGDGYADFAVGAPDANAGAGLVAVFLGGPSPPASPAARLHGRAADDNFGAAVAGAGRTRGGPYADLLVGAPFNSASAVWAGRVYLYFGGGAPDTVPDGMWSGASAGDFFGAAVAGAGDVNGDGRDDFLVGAPGANVGAHIDAGQAYLFLGTTPPATAAAATLSGALDYGELGLAVAGVGDVDADGHADYAVGAPGTPDANTAGLVRFFFGRATPLATPDTTLIGEVGGDQFGHTISNGGRVVDGTHTVFLVGSYAHAGLGRAYLYGAAAGILSVPEPEPARAHAAVMLEEPQPNPGRDAVKLSVDLERASRATLAIVDVSGRRVATLADRDLPAGRHEFVWQAAGEAGRAPPGLYWAVLSASGSDAGQPITRKIVMLGR